MSEAANPKGGKLFFMFTLRISLNSPALLSLNISVKLKLRYRKIVRLIFLIINNGTMNADGRIL
jgi:hypothetical protein